jgi:hypothetical protein
MIILVNKARDGEKERRGDRGRGGGLTRAHIRIHANTRRGNVRDH